MGRHVPACRDYSETGRVINARQIPDDGDVIACSGATGVVTDMDIRHATGCTDDLTLLSLGTNTGRARAVLSHHRQLIGEGRART